MDDHQASQAAEGLGLAAWDLQLDPECVDKVALRKLATDLLFASRETPRPALIEAARNLALDVIVWVDSGTNDSYRKLRRSSRLFEELRILKRLTD
jgi:hypothetical protein